MGYIEKETGVEAFNPTSGTVKVNPDCNCNCNNPSTEDKVGPVNDEINNKQRWAWLVESWEGMSFRSKMKLFTPRVEYIKTNDYEYGDETDEYINEYIIDSMYVGCRTLRNIQFTVNDQSIPCIAITLNPINPDMIPDADVKASVKNWGKRYGFIA